MFLGGYECNRVSVGSYERGPVRIVWDGHDNADIPFDCSPNTTTQDPDLDIVLNAILVSDAEIAAYFQSEYGLPAFFAEITVAAQPVGQLVQRTWSWGVVGQGESELSMQDDGTISSYGFNERLFWQRGETGIGTLDLEYDRESMAPGAFRDQPTYGAMAPPMLAATSPTAHFSGITTYFPVLGGEGSFSLYKDLMCKEPETLGSAG